MTELEDVSHSPAVESFVRDHNRRTTAEVRKGQRWVRFRPADGADLDLVRKDRKALPFVRPGSMCFVLDVNPLTVRCGGDSLVLGMEYFLGSFIRVVEEDETLREQRRLAR